MPPGQPGKRAVEDLLRGELDVRIQGRANLGSNGAAPGQAQHPSYEMTGLDRREGIVEHPGLSPNLLALRRAQCATHTESVRELIDCPAGSGSVTAQVHTCGRAHEHG